MNFPIENVAVMSLLGYSFFGAASMILTFSRFSLFGDFVITPKQLINKTIADGLYGAFVSFTVGSSLYIISNYKQ